MTVKENSAREKLKPEFIEGPKALRNFTETMKKLFRVPKSEIQETSAQRRTKKARRSRDERKSPFG